MSKIRGKYTPLRHAILDCPAWRAMSMGARALYLSIRRRAHHDGSNNGKVRFSNRQAQRELGAKERYVTAWFRELRHYGFVVLTSKGYLGGEGRGVASSWRVTELSTPDSSPTDHYLFWGGELFVPPEKKIPSPTGGTLGKRLQQNPVPNGGDISREL